MGCGASSAVAQGEVQSNSLPASTGTRGAADSNSEMAVVPAPAASTGTEPPAKKKKSVQAPKAVTLDDDSPPSSPGLLPRSTPIIPPSVDMTSASTTLKGPPPSPPADPLPKQHVSSKAKKDSLLLSTSKSKLSSSKAAAARSRMSNGGSDGPGLGDADTEMLRQRIMLATADLDAEQQQLTSPTARKANGASQPRSTRSSKEADGKRTGSERDSAGRGGGDKEREREREKDRKRSHKDKDRHSSRRVSTDTSSRSTRSNKVVEEVKTSPEPVPLQSNPWSAAALAVPTRVETESPLIVTSPPRAAERTQNAASPPHAPVVEPPMELPSWQRGFDPEKFRRANANQPAAAATKKSVLPPKPIITSQTQSHVPSQSPHPSSLLSTANNSLTGARPAAAVLGSHAGLGSSLSDEEEEEDVLARAVEFQRDVLSDAKPTATQRARSASDKSSRHIGDDDDSAISDCDDVSVGDHKRHVSVAVKRQQEHKRTLSGESDLEPHTASVRPYGQRPQHGDSKRANAELRSRGGPGFLAEDADLLDSMLQMTDF